MPAEDAVMRFCPNGHGYSVIRRTEYAGGPAREHLQCGCVATEEECRKAEERDAAPPAQAKAAAPPKGRQRQAKAKKESGRG